LNRKRTWETKEGNAASTGTVIVRMHHFVPIDDEKSASIPGITWIDEDFAFAAIDA